jgi:hypothetical protein
MFYTEAEQKKDVPLYTMPHYTDKRFDKPQTVFGKEEDGLHYDYSDRLWQWDYDKAKLAAAKAENSGAVNKSAAWYEAYLSAYFEKPVELKHVLAGVNLSNGYTYAIFGYKFTGEEA